MKLSTLITVACLTVGCQTAGHTSESPLHDMIRAAAVSHDVDPRIALALVDVESGFKPTASKDGNYGLMQLRYGTAVSMGYTGSLAGLMVPETNIEYGMRYLQYCFNKYNDTVLMLGCYNGSMSIKNKYPKRVLKASGRY